MDEDGCLGLLLFGAIAVGCLVGISKCSKDEPAPAPMTAQQAAQQAAEIKAKEEADTKARDIETRLNRGEVLLFRTAPDGTKLWMTRNGDQTIYFSTGGKPSTGGNVTPVIETPAPIVAKPAQKPR